jgi:ABC-type sugar transport system ATPase subunit
VSEIRVDNLSKEFGKTVVAVRDLTMTFPQATTTCLLGPSGCGKTTLMRMIAGLETPTRGDVYIGGQRITHLPTRKRNIGMVFQYPVVYRGSTVRQNIELPLMAERLSAAERAKRVDEVVDLLEMRHAVDMDVDELDNGTRQKVSVARAVARHPSVLLFDEPLTNVDISSKLQLKRSLKELITRLRQTIIYVTHDQTEAMTLADKIALMQDGAIVQYATPHELYNQPNDVFGGWFLGNPGMNFVENLFESVDASGQARSALFAQPVRLRGAEQAGSPGALTLGIRPEHVRVGQTQSPSSVRGTLLNKSIVTGGQYLLIVDVAGHTLKAKVSADVGPALSGEVWVELPPARVTLFDQAGHKPGYALQPA